MYNPIDFIIGLIGFAFIIFLVILVFYLSYKKPKSEQLIEKYANQPSKSSIRLPSEFIMKNRVYFSESNQEETKEETKLETKPEKPKSDKRPLLNITINITNKIIFLFILLILLLVYTAEQFWLNRYEITYHTYGHFYVHDHLTNKILVYQADKFIKVLDPKDYWKQ